MLFALYLGFGGMARCGVVVPITKSNDLSLIPEIHIEQLPPALLRYTYPPQTNK